MPWSPAPPVSTPCDISGDWVTMLVDNAVPSNGYTLVLIASQMSMSALVVISPVTVITP